MSAASEFAPKPNPSEMPAAMATTFFTQPPIPQPTTSPEVYGRKVFVWKASCTCFEIRSQRAATVTAVGSPFATSVANDGPESTARYGWSGTGRTSSITSLIVMSVSSSIPFATQTMGVPAWTCRFASIATCRTACDGTATTTSSAPSSAFAMSAAAWSEAGSTTPGR